MYGVFYFTVHLMNGKNLNFIPFLKFVVGSILLNLLNPYFKDLNVLEIVYTEVPNIRTSSY